VLRRAALWLGGPRDSGRIGDRARTRERKPESGVAEMLEA
jgi:hypothetical protein